MIAQALQALQRVPGVVVTLVARSFSMMQIREVAENRGRWINAFAEVNGYNDEDGGAWCAHFGWFCWRVAGLLLGYRVASRTSGSVVQSWLNATDAERVTDTPKPGDLMCIVRRARDLPTVRAGGRVPGHMEIVRRVHGDGSLDTIGGNTTGGDSAEGDGVYLHRGTYSLDDPRLIGFIRPTLERLT